MKTVSLGGRTIGDSDFVFVIAEIGVNHDGDVALAHQLIDMAADSGSDAVKFQTFSTDTLVSPSAVTAPYQQRLVSDDKQIDMLQRLVLPRGAWSELAAHAARRQLVFLSTPFDQSSAEMLMDVGVPAMKVASGELTNHRLLSALAGMDVPLLISTGMADQAEVDAAVDIAAAAPSFALLHCVSAYPAPHADANLRSMATMQARYDVPVGWSDHTPDGVCTLGAVALGARLIERHITTDRSRPGPDHSASLEFEEMCRYVTDIRLLSTALGSGIKERAASEQENAPLARRSWHATRDLAEGHKLEADDIVALRPETGIGTAQAIVGRLTTRPVAAGSSVAEDDLVPS
jgi:N-acetylneuraminate synthase/N,N'-diacetyllegionaminate synthase